MRAVNKSVSLTTRCRCGVSFRAILYLRGILPNQNLIVIGASAGGVEALQRLAADLPANLNAAVCIVVHIGNGIDGKSLLPAILNHVGALPAINPHDGEGLQDGRIYIAPPDHHMIVKPGHVHILHGPKENNTRPAINPLFRSAAAAYGPRVIGVILSGMLDDGTAGLAEIKRQGGVAIVQDPKTAAFPSMPLNAIQHVDVDHTVPLSEIASLLGSLVKAERIMGTEIVEQIDQKLLELKCPECNGPIWEKRQGKIVEYGCRVGHVYSPLSFAKSFDAAVERSLWDSVVTLEQSAKIGELLGDEFTPAHAKHAQKSREQAATLRAMLESKAEDEG